MSAVDAGRCGWNVLGGFEKEAFCEKYLRVRDLHQLQNSKSLLCEQIDVDVVEPGHYCSNWSSGNGAFSASGSVY